jgi:hypothetical protein
MKKGRTHHELRIGRERKHVKRDGTRLDKKGKKPCWFGEKAVK